MYPSSAVDWVCAAAAGNHSPSSCGPCAKAWNLPAIAPPRAPVSWAALPLPSVRPRLAWFTCVTKPSAADSTGWDNLAHLRAAVVSARLNAPSLAPHVVYLHSPDQPLEDDGFSRWLRAAGARVILHRLSFYEAIPASRRKQPNVGINSHVDIGTCEPVVRRTTMPWIAIQCPG